MFSRLKKRLSPKKPLYISNDGAFKENNIDVDDKLLTSSINFFNFGLIILSYFLENSHFLHFYKSLYLIGNTEIIILMEYFVNRWIW